MTILGIETLIYGVGDVAESGRFFDDFGLQRSGNEKAGSVDFKLPEGSFVTIRHRDDPSLMPTKMEGDGVRQIIWGVADTASLEALADDLSRDHELLRSDDGTVHFMTAFGIAMGLKVYSCTPVASAPDPVNSPGKVNRLNHHRKWRERARPKVLNHVVFMTPDFDDGAAFMQERLNFRLSDLQRNFGVYLRAPGSTAHHNLLLLNANAPIPDCDGNLRFHHANFGVEDIDEIMAGANHMTRKGWEASHVGLGRHRIDSALFYYIPSPAGGEAEYGADADMVDDSWIPREWINPLFGYMTFAHNLPPFMLDPPSWNYRYLTEEAQIAVAEEVS